MSTPKSPTLAQKKKRLVQLREAQRRRRERLREEKQHFVQIILPEQTIQQLSRMIAASGETMQQIIARLVQSALPEEAETLPSNSAAAEMGALAASVDVEAIPAEEPVSIEETEDRQELVEALSVVASPETEAKSFPEEPAPAELEEIMAVDSLPTEPALEESNEPLVLVELPVTKEEVAPERSGQLDLFG
ncbi:MAG TPA: hypothetical protein VF585_03620 [Chthoniobacterales bacterium]|jgi:hypothetical protein